MLGGTYLWPHLEGRTMKLTDKACKSAQTKEKTYTVSDGGGMFLEVNKNGSKYWRMKYRFNGKQKKLAFGVYPDVTLREARELRDNAKKDIKIGIDPAIKKKMQKLEVIEASANTFESIAREWHTNNLSMWTVNHGKEILRRFENDIFPEIGQLPITSIKAPLILAVIRKIEKRGVHELAQRALQNISRIFRYAVVTGRAEYDPSSALKGALMPFKKGHHAALGINDIPDFMQALSRNDARLFPHTRLALELIIHTFVRTNELIGMKWEEIDLDNKMWAIPGERMKMRKEHLVPLSSRSVEIIKELMHHRLCDTHVFPNRVKRNGHMSDNTILTAIARLGYKGKTTGHGFRALAMSAIKEKLGYRHEVVDRQLAHAHRSKIDAAYDRADFLDERIKMMQEWSDYIESMKQAKVA